MLAAAGFVSCSDNDDAASGQDGRKGMLVEGAALSANGDKIVSGVQSRAGDEFAVLTANDPTYPFESKNDWSLDVQIYKGSAPYTYGQGTFVWNSGQSLWMPRTTPGDEIYFPNYTKQRVTLKLYPDTWSGTIDTDQGTAAKLLAQDIMVEGSDPMPVDPAHKPEMEIRHGNSMFDIILKDVGLEQLVGGRVILGDKVYTPYRVPNVDHLEYLLIVPVGSGDPVIEVETSDGAKYHQTVYISPTRINTCYCFTLQGLELRLSANMVADWITGEAQSGDYSSVTSYPTFKGPENGSCTVYYDNGLEQELVFNSRGEATVKPSGRNIVRVTSADPVVDVNIDPPLILGTMTVDLRPYLGN